MYINIMKMIKKVHMKIGNEKMLEVLPGMLGSTTGAKRVNG